MIKVVDANYFQSQELNKFLEYSKENIVAFTDYACMEAYKGDSLTSVAKSIKIVSHFPTQVVILKGTQEITKITTKPFNINDLIDKEQTEEFGKFCNLVELAKQGNSKILNQIRRHGFTANNHFEKMMIQAEQLGRAFILSQEIFSDSELRIIKSKKTYTENIINIIIEQVNLLAKAFIEKYPTEIVFPNIDAYNKSYIFRFSLCGYLLAMNWISNGVPSDVKTAKLRNDVVDITYATYATYFDGY